MFGLEMVVVGGVSDEKGYLVWGGEVGEIVVGESGVGEIEGERDWKNGW